MTKGKKKALIITLSIAGVLAIAVAITLGVLLTRKPAAPQVKFIGPKRKRFGWAWEARTFLSAIEMRPTKKTKKMQPFTAMFLRCR